MSNAHPHADAIDRLGRKRISKHFQVTDRTIQLWRAKGIPKMHWRTILMLAAADHVSLPAFEQPEAERSPQ